MTPATVLENRQPSDGTSSVPINSAGGGGAPAASRVPRCLDLAFIANGSTGNNGKTVTPLAKQQFVLGSNPVSVDRVVAVTTVNNIETANGE